MPGYLESYRGCVLARECDIMGHMNIQFYTACIGHATTTIAGAAGLTPDVIQTHKRGFAAVEQTSKYYAELLADDIIHMESAIVASSTKTLTFHHRLFNSASGVLSFEATMTSAYMDLEKRKAIPLDHFILPNLKNLQVDPETAQ
ncbi:MAG: thioesterase family protein [Sneathiella sp.]